MIDVPEHLLRGSYPPLITPFRDGAVDHETFERLVDWQVESESHGVVVTGTTGEPFALTVAERAELYRRAVDVAAGRMPVVAATGAPSLAETVELCRAAESAGAAASLVVTPCYSKPPQRAIVDYYATVGAASDLPMLLYHIPGRAGVSVDATTVLQIAERVEHFVGVKHSAYDLIWMTEVLATLPPGFRVLVGVEELTFPMLCVGAAGLVNAAANIVPDRVAAMYEAVATGRLDEGRRLHFDLFDLNRSVFWDTNPIGVKYMMRRLGLIDSNEHRLPLSPATPDLERRLDVLLERLGVLAPSAT